MNILMSIRRFLKSIPYAFRRTKIKVVHEDDLNTLITSLGIADDFIRGKFFCICCKSPITIDNLWGIMTLEGSIQLLCSDPVCLSDII